MDLNYSLLHFHFSLEGLALVFLVRLICEQHIFCFCLCECSLISAPFLETVFVGYGVISGQTFSLKGLDISPPAFCAPWLWMRIWLLIVQLPHVKSCFCLPALKSLWGKHCGPAS